MESLKTKKWLAYIIMGILTLAGIYGEFAICLMLGGTRQIIELVLTTVMFIFILIYVVSNYKTPHGNLLKYLFLAFSVMCLVGILDTDFASLHKEFVYVNQLSRGLAIIMSGYIAGRLDRIKTNTILVVVIGIIFMVTSVINIVLFKITTVSLILYMCSFFILWLDLAVAYILRYKEHKEAGIAADKD